MTFEFEVYCKDCGSSHVEDLEADEQTNLPIFICQKCSQRGSFGIEFSYLEIK